MRLVGDPLGEVRVVELGERHQHVTGDGAVLLHVVAGQDGEGLQPLLATPLEGGAEEAEGADGCVQVGQIMLDIWVLSLQLVGVFVVVVATLGDGQGHNVRVGVSHLGNDGLLAIRGEEERPDAADDAGIAALGRALNDGVQVVLGVQDIAHGSVVGPQTDTADGPAVLAMALQQPVDVDGQMGSVEAADADVDNALLDVTAVVRGDLDGLVLPALLGGDGREVLAVELEASHCRSDVMIGGL